MRWSCPHCGISLSASDEKLNAGWSYTRCYQCGGFSLVRSDDKSVIKVEQPVTKTVSNPPQTQPNNLLLGQEAVKHLSNHGYTVQNYQGQSARPVIRKSTRVASQPSLPGTTAGQPVSVLPALPPLPAPQEDWKTRALPAAIGLAAALAIFSGIYLYIQGQSLWRKATVSLHSKHQNTVHSEPLPSRNFKKRTHLIEEEDSDGPRAEAPALPAAQMIDSIRHEAKAPLKEVPGEILVVKNQAAREIQSLEKQEIQDYLQEEVEQVGPPDSGREEQALVLRPKSRDVLLRSGPGKGFKAIAVANTRSQYLVRSWSKDWFKVVPINNPKAHPLWVRNDLMIPARP